MTAVLEQDNRVRQRTTFRLGYRPALDGLRGICILLVIAYHIHLPFTSGGLFGVDGFFVLSGFLITTLLLQEFSGTQAISLPFFYARRVLRLFPALFTLLLVCAIGTLLFESGRQAQDNWRGIGSAVVYMSNWTFAIVQPASAGFNALGILQHTWSLAVEEQFYLLWPPLLVLMLMRSKRASILVTVGLLIFASMIVRVVLFERGASYYRLYSGTDTRADALLIGCLLGLVVSWGVLDNLRWLKTLSRLCLVFALPLLVFLVGTADRHSPFFAFGGYTLVALAVASLILYVMVSPKGWLTNVLSWSPLVKIGMISYGLYLWHYPIFQALTPGRHGLTMWETMLLRLAATLIITLLSFRYIERPLLRLKTRLSNASLRVAHVPIHNESL